jgi:hypothetical protein
MADTLEIGAVPDWSRRRLLQAGGLASLGLPQLLAAQFSRAQEPPGRQPEARIQACILIFYYGGPSHLDMFDTKPGAPAEVRGEFKSIATSVPGLRICEHLPLTARIMHKVAVVRSLHHGMRNHDSACAETFTGRIPPGGDKENFIPVSESAVFPSCGAALSYLRPGRAAPLSHATLPFFIHNVVHVPGQMGGFLGAAHHPFLIEGDPDALTYRSDALQLPRDVSASRFADRQSLLAKIGELGVGAESMATMRPFYRKAFELLRSEAVRRALHIEEEPQAVRERYGLGPRGQSYQDGPMGDNGAHLGIGRNLRGQNLLLARRLVEAGVPFVTVSDFKQQGKNWDSHAQNFSQLKEHLLPPADRAFAALVEDLDARGLLETTLVVALGEFGRTPRVNAQAGRDHWPDCYSAVLAGGGVQGGAVFGVSDKIGAFPAADPVTPADLAATIFWRFGIDPATEIRDPTGRPYKAADGEPVRRLFG